MAMFYFAFPQLSGYHRVSVIKGRQTLDLILMLS